LCTHGTWCRPVEPNVAQVQTTHKQVQEIQVTILWNNYIYSQNIHIMTTDYVSMLFNIKRFLLASDLELFGCWCSSRLGAGLKTLSNTIVNRGTWQLDFYKLSLKSYAFGLESANARKHVYDTNKPTCFSTRTLKFL